MKIYKTDRDYQKAWCDFIITFKGFEFYDDNGCKLDKMHIFNAIYQNHTYINTGKPFDQKADVTIQLLKTGNHPSIETRKRYYKDFIETDAINEAMQTTLSKRAIVIVREEITTETITSDQAIGLVIKGMAHGYQNHESIDKEIDSEISG